jgi:hypothetical protein
MASLSLQKLEQKGSVTRVVAEPRLEALVITEAYDEPKRIDGRLRCAIVPADRRRCAGEVAVSKSICRRGLPGMPPGIAPIIKLPFLDEVTIRIAEKFWPFRCIHAVVLIDREATSAASIGSGSRSRALTRFISRPRPRANQAQAL